MVLLFSHGGALRLDVECLECELADLGADDVGISDLDEGAESSGLGRDCFYLARRGKRPDRPGDAKHRPVRSVPPRGGFGWQFPPVQGLTAISRRAIEHRPAIEPESRHARPPRQKQRRFRPALRHVSRRQARGVGRRRAGVRAIIADVAARGDAALIEATRKFDRLDLDAKTAARDRGRDRCRREGLRRPDARCARLRARPHRDLSPAADAEGRALHRCARASNSAGAGPRSTPSVSTCRAARRPIRPRC